MELTGRNLVAGEWLDGDAGQAFHAVNPAGRKKLDPGYSCASPLLVDRAVRKAKSAFLGFRNLSPSTRADFLECLASKLEAVSEGLVTRAKEESGLSTARLEMELSRMVGQPRRFAALLREGAWVDARIDLGDPTRQPRPKPSMRTILQPLGPVAVFGASNFPLAISVTGTDTVSAFAAGCPVIVKAHPAQPGTCEMLASVVLHTILECGLDPAIFSILNGNGTKVGEQLVKHPDLSAVAFTGSLPGGRSLMDMAASRPVPIPVFAEMGSLNPVFLLPGALEGSTEAIAQGLFQSLTMDAGQFCTNPGVLLAVRSPTLDRFLNRFRALVSQASPQTMLHQGIFDNYQKRLEEISQTPGLETLARPTVTMDPTQLHAGPMLFMTDFQSWKSQQSLHDECFGPSTILVSVASKEELLEFALSMQGSLTATFHGTPEDFDTHQELQRILETRVGRLVFNGFPTGVEIGHATHHGGPYPATSTPAHTSIGLAAIRRFTRPVCFQNSPDSQLPPGLQDDNPLQIQRMVDGKLTSAHIQH